MRINQVDLNLLVIFDAIYEARNLTRASEVLHITQPAVSNALNRLRATFSDPLFVRSPQGMTPTPFSRSIAVRVRESLELMESCVAQDVEFDPSTSDKTLLCSFSDLAEAFLLPALVSKVQEAAPMMSIRSYYVAREELPNELAAGTLDIGVDVAFVNDRSLHHVPLLTEEYVCAVRKDHPFIKRKPTLKQYLSAGHVHVSSRRKGVGTVDQSLKTLGHRRNIVTRVRDYAAMPYIIASTDLSCTMPRRLAEHSGLRAYQLPFETPAVSIHLFWHKSADADPANRWLRSLLTSA